MRSGVLGGMLLFVAVVLLVLVYLSSNWNSISPLPSDRFYNVQSFGAQGDGIADDSYAIQSALDLAYRNRAAVYFPAGVYLVNPLKPVTVYSNTKVIGEGNRSVIKANSATFGQSMVHLHGKNIQVSRIKFDGNNSVNRVVVIQPGSSNIRISQSTVAHASQSKDIRANDLYRAIVCGILVYGDTDRISIDQTEIHDIRALHELDGTYIARGVYITTSWQSAEKVSTRFSMTRSKIRDISPADDGDCIYYEDPNLQRSPSQKRIRTMSLIADNLFDNCAKRAIKIYAEGITVTGNEVINRYLNNNYYLNADNGNHAPDMYSGISIYASHNTITNNVLRGSGSYYAGIELGASEPLSNIIVINNRITMGSKSDIANATAIRAEWITNYKIASNVIVNGTKGIWLRKISGQGTIKDNRISVPSGSTIITD